MDSSLLRLLQVKKGQTWESKAGFGTFTWALVFILCLGLTFNSLLKPSAVGGLYAWIGMPDKAVSALTTAVKAHPNDADAYYNRGIAYLQSGKPNKAVDDMTQAIKLQPKRADAHLMRAVTHVLLGDEDNAKPDIQHSEIL